MPTTLFTAQRDNQLVSQSVSQSFLTLFFLPLEILFFSREAHRLVIIEVPSIEQIIINLI